MEDFVKALVKLYELISDSAVSTLLAMTGFLVFVVAILLLHHQSKARPEEVARWHRPLLLSSLAIALLLSIAAPSLRMLEISRSRAEPTRYASTRSAILGDLYANKKVYWLVRLIPYTPASRDFLNISKIKNLGRCDPDTCGGTCKQQYVFVADYAELRGLTAEQAVLKVGGSMDEVIGVSAVFFPLHNHDLFPATARGLLQLVERVDNVCKGTANYVNFPMTLLPAEVTDLEIKKIPSYNWDQSKRYYQHYCQIAQKFRCAGDDKKSYSALEHIGSLSSDWHPLGFSRTKPDYDPCDMRDIPCSISSWGPRNPPVEDVGARVFLIQNFSLDQLSGRILIDFNNPSRQLMPEIDERLDSL